MKRNQLGGVIFGCTRSTMKECLSKQLFGLPAQHFSYVKNIDQGLPLFLFNYTDRKLHGIFEASSKGKMYIDPYAWINDDYSDETQYPAQVKVRVRLQCHPLSEDKFRKVIAKNYYDKSHFRFELDNTQASKLMYLLTSAAIAPGTPVPRCNMKWRSVCPSLPSCQSTKKDRDIQLLHARQIKKEIDADEKNRICKKLFEMAYGKKNQGLSLLGNANEALNENKIRGDIEAPPSLYNKENNNASPTLEMSFQFENSIKYFQYMSSIGIYTSQVHMKVLGSTTEGRWISIQSNVEKRFNFAAMEHNNSLHGNSEYGGFDHLMYTLGGFDESTMVPYMELFDPCLEARMELMNHLGNFYDATDLKECMESKESKFLKTF